MKAGIVKPCDKVTCGTLWDEAKEEVAKSYTLIEKEIAKQTYAASSSLAEIKKVPSVQTDVFSEAHRHLSAEINLPSKSYDAKSVTFDKGMKEDKNKERFKTIINDDDHFSGKFSELKTTASGNLAIELDETVIKLIEEKSQENPNLFVSLHESDSGQYTINFSPSNNDDDKSQKISITKSLSGTRILKVRKTFLNMLKENKTNEIKTSTGTDVTDEIKENDSCEMIFDAKGLTENSKYVSDIFDATQHLIKKNNSYLLELQRLWNDNTKNIMINVVGQNKLCKKIKGTLLKTLSGNIAVDVTAISTFGDIVFKSGECPALMTQCAVDTFLLEVKGDDNYNVLLRRSTLGEILLVTPETSKDEQFLYEIKPKNEFFRVKVKSSNKVVKEPPAVLKVTPSRNYTFVLDKEYEKQFSDEIDKCIRDNTECLVELDKTNSGTFLVNLDNDESDESNDNKALLLKSSSGNLKMLVNVPLLSPTGDTSPRKNSNTSSKAFEHLLEMLPSSTGEFSRKNTKKTILNDAKSSSDSQLYEKVKMKIPDHKDLFEPSTALTRTPSGQYVAVLNKESKKAFVDRLTSYLSGSQGLIPIKRTESGKITISLNSKSDNNCGYGSLKITPSGNIYVMVNEKVIEGMVEDVKHGQGASLGDELSKHIIKRIKSPVNKAVTTTCNAKPDTSSCDTSKCVCKEWHLGQNKWFQDNCKDSPTFLKSQNHCIDLTNVRKNQDDGYKICDPQKCKEPCRAGNPSAESSSEKTPHIVIKPCDCRPVLAKNPRSKECCYVVEAVCPYHIDSYKTLSNELFEITDLCNKALENRNLSDVRKNTSDKTNKERNWDSLKYLPPQLPKFLQDLSFR